MLCFISQLTIYYWQSEGFLPIRLNGDYEVLLMPVDQACQKHELI